MVIPAPVLKKCSRAVPLPEINAVNSGVSSSSASAKPESVPVNVKLLDALPDPPTATSGTAIDPASKANVPMKSTGCVLTTPSMWANPSGPGNIVTVELRFRVDPGTHGPQVSTGSTMTWRPPMLKLVPRNPNPVADSPVPPTDTPPAVAIRIGSALATDVPTTNASTTADTARR